MAAARLLAVIFTTGQNHQKEPVAVRDQKVLRQAWTAIGMYQQIPNPGDAHLGVEKIGMLKSKELLVPALGMLGKLEMKKNNTPALVAAVGMSRALATKKLDLLEELDLDLRLLGLEAIAMWLLHQLTMWNIDRLSLQKKSSIIPAT
jgi:hypothetical protein